MLRGSASITAEEEASLLALCSSCDSVPVAALTRPEAPMTHKGTEEPAKENPAEMLVLLGLSRGSFTRGRLLGALHAELAGCWVKIFC